MHADNTYVNVHIDHGIAFGGTLPAASSSFDQSATKITRPEPLAPGWPITPIRPSLGPSIRTS